MSSQSQHPDHPDEEDEEAIIGEGEADEEFEGDEDVPMDDADDDEFFALQNDSAAHFNHHKDSIFCIAQHPVHSSVVATGGGDDLAYIWDSTPLPPPVLPTSYETSPQAPPERQSLPPIARLEGHTDSVNAVTFTLPHGTFIATGGLDGQLRVWRDASAPASAPAQSWSFLSAVQEVEEVNWLAACPSPGHPNVVALGADDGSVWVYEINAESSESPLGIVQAFYLHTASCTAGCWTPDGRLLATVSEDGSLYVWDVWGDAGASGMLAGTGAQYVVGMTGEDERFRVEGGLYSVAISPGGALCAVGGADGMIRVVGLPRFTSESSAGAGARGEGAKSKAGGAKRATASSSAGQAGQILASLQAQEESVETITFSAPPLTIMAAGSVDGTIVLFDAAHNFAVRRKIEEAHDEEAVIQVQFVKAGPTGADGYLLTSCGNDGVVRRWDCRGGTTADGKGLVREWRGHRGGGDGGGVLGFVQRDGKIVTAGDDAVSLVFQE